MLRIGIDIGGTFTDFSVFDEDDGRVVLSHKVPSQPDDPTGAILEGLAEIRARVDGAVSYVLHGTTIGLNTLLQGREAAPGLVVTEGFRDLLELDRQWRGDQVYNLFFDRPRLLVPRRLARTVRERVGPRGEVVTPLDIGAARRTIEGLIGDGVRSIAVSLLFSFANPAHEQTLRRIISELHPETYVSLSSEVNPEFREFERTSTTVANAYIGPRVSRYFASMQARVREVLDGASVFIMQSSGGVATPEMVSRTPVHTLMSGPVAGVVAARRLGEQTGREQLISIDIGGTSCDMSVIPGELLLSPQSTVGGYTVRASTVDIATLGSGGGSIARVEAGRILKVGPQSAGAVPGPACYGRGTEPTLTDALVVLGHLDQRALLGGRMPISAAAAREAISGRLAEPLSLGVEATAVGVIEVLAAQVAASMRSITIEKGYDPRDFSLAAFGGAGPTVACPIAAELGIPEIVVPPDPGNFCATGMLQTDLVRSYSLTRISLVGQTTFEELSNIFGELERRGVEELQAQHLAREQIVIERLLDMRYLGQSYEVTVPVERLGEAGDLGQVAENFHRVHGRIYGHKAEGEPVEIVNYRLRAVGVLPKFSYQARPTGDEQPPRPDHERTTRFPGRREAHATPVYERADLQPGCRVRGPAIIEEFTSTTVVYPSFELEVDRYGNLVLRARG